MKNINYMQVAVIMFFIIIIILVVVLVRMTQGNDERLAKTKAAEDRAQAAEQKQQQLTRDLMAIKAIVGQKDDTDIAEVEKTHQDVVMRLGKNANVGAQSYLAILQNLANELSSKNEAHKNVQDALTELEATYQNLNELYSTVVDKYAEEKSRADQERDDERTAYARSISDQRKEFDVVQAEKLKIQSESQDKIKSVEEKAASSDKLANQVQNKNLELATVLEDLRRSNFERPDGKILSVNQQSGIVTVNLGSDDGLATRTTFSVYAPTITGIAMGDDPQKAVNLCDVCKRDQSLSVSKASIEIVKILGPHRSEARILDDNLFNPIVSGDVVFTPVWKPGQVQRFALTLGMNIPGVGRRDGQVSDSNLTEIIHLITANGGVVDCYISDGADGRPPRGEIEGKIDSNTTYIVVGEISDVENQDKKSIDAYEELLTDAKHNAVKKITLNELLSRMGWKNVTPIRGFGPMAQKSDYNIQSTGENRASVGIVSPIYQPHKATSRLFGSEGISRPSTGRVSDIYNDSATSAPRSTGSTTELFRPRTPPTTAP